MTFEIEVVEDFIKIFNLEKATILSFEGCTHVELLRDLRKPHLIFTYSKWESEEYLERYRNSEFFKGTWEKAKKLFSEKPEAWSLVSPQGGKN